MTHANDNTPRPAWFDQILIDYQPFIYKRCIAEKADIDVEATAQDITLRAMEKWHQYKPTHNFATWLSFMCRDVLRAGKRKVAVPCRVLTALPTQEYATDLSKVMDRLTKREARAVTLMATGYSKTETSKKMRLSRQGLYNVLERAKVKVTANDNQQTRVAA